MAKGVKPPKKAASKPPDKPARRKQAPARKAPGADPLVPTEAILAASAEVGIPAAAPPPAPEAREAEADAVRAEQAALLAQATAEGVAEDALRQLEETLGEPITVSGPVDVPGFEDEAAAPEPPPSPGETSALVAMPAPAHTGPDAFFTSDSPGAESPGMGDQFAGLLSLVKDVAFQTLTSERLSRTVSSARGLLGAAFTGLGLGTGSSAIDEYGKDASLTTVLQPVLDFLYERYWRVSVQGASHVPAGPVLLVANHSGALPFDGPMLQQALSRERPDLQEARWLAEDQVFHAPVMGTLVNRLGAVRACPENALRLLDELRPVIVFPEGSHGLGKPFAQRYQLKRFGRGGFVKLALRTGAPIVPVAIVGAEETVPLLGKLPAGLLGLPYLPVTLPPLPARWMIRFGEPIGMGELPPEAAEDLGQVHRLTERTRESIQGMLQALLKERRSVFTG